MLLENTSIVASSNRRVNNFDGLRLLGALAVLVGHAYVLTGNGPPASVLGIRIDALGVAVFFSISGYLIAVSWMRNPRLLSFFRHRALRIFPALLVVLVVTTFVVGPFSTTLSTGSYFRSGETWQYTGLSAILLAQYHLPGVFTGISHVTSAVNGSLWTLGVEFSCYCAVAVAGLVLRARAGIAFVVMAAIGVLLTAVEHGPNAAKAVADGAPVIVYFAVGALIAILLQKTEIRARWAILVAAVWACAYLLWPEAALPFSWLALPWCVIALGRSSTPVFRRASKFGDLSYGIYLWAFVVQQVVVDRFGRLPVGLDILIVGLIAAGLAFVSWRLIESRALAFKDGRMRRREENEATPEPAPTFNSAR